MKIKQAVITAAGFGSRFLPIVKSIPKEMLPIVDKPIIQILVEECFAAGIEEVIIVVRKGNNLIRDYFERQVPEIKTLLQSQGKMDRYAEVEKVLNMKGIKIIEQFEDLPYGNGSPIVSAKEYLDPDGHFAVLFGDDLVLSEGKGALAQIIELFENYQCDGVNAAQEVTKNEISKYGSIAIKAGQKFEGYGQVDYVIEKPEPDQAPSTLASYGRYILPYKIFDFLTPDKIGKDNELWLFDSAGEFAKSNKYMYKIVEGEWVTTGDPFNYFQALMKYYLAHPKLGEDIKELIDVEK
ncbi:MAG TPA: sugar phosphate nucleotidyltransferase [Candidatus Dojkabacteria bacterium]|nr:sugar phosphate nucleotidyltransferase [Candidatus Dojkabacteria bacterium]